MKQDSSGGYCPRCDTLWASPGVCRCKIDKSKMSEEDKLYWSKYTPSVFETEIWNKAIEAAAVKSYELFDERDFAREVCANEIRKLKR